MGSNRKAIAAAKKYMLRSCGKGNQCACTKAKNMMASEQMMIQAGAMVMLGADKDDGHVNNLPFKGVLLLVDVASTKPPHGSRGHRIYVPKSVAEKKLSGLIGMGINYDHIDLDSHETRHKVGVITEARVKGDQVWVNGIIWKKDFPEAVKDLRRGGLGMSMELADVYVRDEHEDVWHLEDFVFTGATILKKSAAAYYGTELVAMAGKLRKPAMAALAAAASGTKRKGEGMKKEQDGRKVTAAASDTGQGALLVQAMEGAMGKSLAPMLAELKASNERVDSLRSDVEELKGLYLIQAAAQDDGDEFDIHAGRHEDDEEAAREEDDDEEMSASGKNKQDDDDDDPSDRQDDSDGEDDDLDAMEQLELDPADQDPGEINKDAKNKGDKTTVTNPPKQKEHVAGNIAKGRLSSAALAAARGKKLFPGIKSSSGAIEAAAVQISTLMAQVQQSRKLLRKFHSQMEIQASAHKKEIKKLRGQYSVLEAQAEKWSEQVDRRSQIPVDIRNLAAKNGVDIREINASGEKVPVEVVDKWFRVAEQQGIQIEPSRRAGMKTEMHRLGLMESGEIPFGGVN